MLLDSAYGIPLFAYVGLAFAGFFALSALSSPFFRQPRLMRYHKNAGRIAVVLGLLHASLASLALFFKIFI